MGVRGGLPGAWVLISAYADGSNSVPSAAAQMKRLAACWMVFMRCLRLFAAAWGEMIAESPAGSRNNSGQSRLKKGEKGQRVVPRRQRWRTSRERESPCSALRQLSGA